MTCTTVSHHCIAEIMIAGVGLFIRVAAENVAVPVRSAEGSFRLSDRRLQQFGTPQAITAAVCGNLTAMEFQNIVKSKEFQQRRNLLGKLLERSAETLVDVLAGLT